MGDRLAVIGGDAAGMAAAATAIRREPDLDVVVYERGGHTSYSACGIPFHVSKEVEHLEDLVARTPEQHRRNGLDVRMGCEVLELDLDAGRLTFEDHAAGTGRRSEPFDRLLVATGARADPPDVPGADAVEPARTMEAASRLRAAIDLACDRGEKQAVVVGGGYIGLELAEAMRHRGLEVVLLDAGPHVFGPLDADMAQLVHDAAVHAGIEVLTDTAIDEVLLDGHGRPRGVRWGQTTREADHVVLATGVHPEVDLARRAGLQVGESGALACGADQRAPGFQHVWVAGDCAEQHHRLLEKAVNLQLGTHANKQGRIAGVNATGSALQFPGVIGTAISRVCGKEIALTGLTEESAAKAGFDAVSETVETDTRAGYMPESGPMTVKLTAERGTGRLLGAQVVGAPTAGKRIDTLAMAVWTGMDVEALQWVDLSYAPPVSGTLDPVLVAARVVAKAL